MQPDGTLCAGAGTLLRNIGCDNVMGAFVMLELKFSNNQNFRSSDEEWSYSKKLSEKRNYIIAHIIEVLLSIPKTLYFNFSVLPISKAFKLPVFVSHRVKLRGINSKTIKINGNLRFASIRIGFGASRFSVESSRNGLVCVENGLIELGERAGLSEGIILDAKNARISLGKHFRCNYATMIVAENDDIIFGDECVLGWRVKIRNFDGHSIIENGLRKKNSEKIVVGNHVWICSCSDILKGVRIENDSVVGYRSLVTRKFSNSNILIGGSPAKVLKECVNWEE